MKNDRLEAYPTDWGGVVPFWEARQLPEKMLLRNRNSARLGIFWRLRWRQGGDCLWGLPGQNGGASYGEIMTDQAGETQ
jgi:hypothetical protein